MARSRSAGPRYESGEVLEAFVHRARRIEAHSLAADKEALVNLAQGETTVEFLPAEQKAYLVRHYPPEEQVESALARLRPVLLDDDIVSYHRVLRALGVAVAANPDLTRLVRGLKKDWGRLRKGHPEGLGSFLQQMDEHGNKSPVLSAAQLADAWIYGDVIHHDPQTIAGSRMFDIHERFRAAAQLTAYGMLLTIGTLNLVRKVHDSGLLPHMNRTVFETDVVATERNYRQKARVWLAEVGTAGPADIDQPFGEGWSELVSAIRDPGPAEVSQASAENDFQP